MLFTKQIIGAFFILVVVSCSQPDTTPAPVVLRSATDKISRTSGELKNFLAKTGLALSPDILQHDVDVYSVTYQTTYFEKVITASGLVILPKTTDSVGMVSFHHGTIASHGEAPSVLSLYDPEVLLYTCMASPGFIAVIPDFIGFGSSSNVPHPYYVEDASASAVIDLLKAARELALQKKVAFNGKLFLAGYSQGGYVTMATHKAIESNGLANFKLIASFPSSGGYDIKGMQHYLFAQEIYNEPFFIADVALAYQTYYHWSAPLTDFFIPRYAAAIPSLFDGTKTGSQINDHLNDTIPKFINPDLLATIDTNPKYHYIVDGFTQNSLLDWKPTVRMYMFHGDADTTIPFQNSIDTYNQLINNGASPATLTLTAFAGATHGTGVVPYIETFVPMLISLK
jgi:pimeloyl-ACP methyl ester carboxylesterase